MTGDDPRGAFVDGLTAIAQRGDRAALAQLRRGAGRPTGSVPEASRVVFGLLPRELRSNRWAIDECWLVATLFALHPRITIPAHPRNLGATLAALDAAGAERHLTAILGADREDLDWHLRRIVLLARSHDVEIDYHQLLGDLRWWSTERATVQRAWALAFWAPQATDDDPATPEGRPQA